METQKKIKEMQDALLIIKRLMPEVEAELSRMGGVGAASGKQPQKDLQFDILKRFHKTTKTR